MSLEGSELTGLGSVPTAAGAPPQGTPGGPFPGYGPAPPAVGPTSQAGAAATASRSDHTHAAPAGSLLRLMASAVASPTGALACAVPGALVGDLVTAIDMTGVLTSAQTSTHFEATVSVANQVQQLTAYPGGNICVLLVLRRP